MKLLSGEVHSANKILIGLLAAVVVGLGVQTWFLVRVHDRLSTEAPRQAVLASATKPATPGTQSPDTMAPNAFAEFEEAEARMRRLFGDFQTWFERDFGAPWTDGHPFFSGGDSFLFDAGGQLGPRADLQDRGDHYEISLDIPGAEQADVDIEARDGQLIVTGTRSSEREESKPGEYMRRERQYGSFERRLPLPDDADPAALRSELENGVLRVAIDKRT